MPKIFRYVIKTDAGTAPNADDGLLSLCICKPKIRLGAEEGDYVVGFLSVDFKFGRGRVSWIGQIAEVLSLGDYRLQYPRRADAIYQRIGRDGDVEVLQHIGGNLHPDRMNQERDKRGKNALLMKRFWYWGSGYAPPVLPDELSHLVPAPRGHTHRGTKALDVEALETWLCSQPEGKHGTYRSLNQGKRSVGGAGCNPCSPPASP